MECFSLLPEDCVSGIIALTSPRDACRLSEISCGFKSAADSDIVWENFLPPDYQEIISRSSPPLVFSTKKELFRSLCDSPILLDGGRLSFGLDKASGKKCYTIPARELSIAWKDEPRYWSWISLPESRFSEVAQLLAVCWLDIRGKIKTNMLSAKTTYAAYLIFKIVGKHSGLESLPVKASVRFVQEIERENENEDNYTSKVYLKLSTFGPMLAEHVGRLPQERKKGWMAIELGEFYNDQGDDNGEMEMRLREISYLNWKSGLIVEGIELRPKVNA